MSKKCAQIMLFLTISAMSLAVSYVGVPKGMMYQACVEYVDPNSIQITAGYGECSGNYFEVTETQVYDVNYIPTGEDFIYIYVDDSESDYPVAAFCDSIIEPEWSDAKLGWYNGNDRCIGVVWTENSSNEIKYFTNNSDNKCIGEFKKVIYRGTAPTSMQTLECTAYVPVIARSVAFYCDNWDFDDWAAVGICAYENEWSRIYCHAWQDANVSGWIELKRGASRDFKYWGQITQDEANQLNIWIYGYQIER